jgi:protease I
MAQSLQGKRIAFMATDGVEQVELTEPWKACREAGAETHLISIKSGEIQAFNNLDKGDKFTVDKTVDQVSANDYDAYVQPGGVANPDFLRMNPKAVAFTRAFFDQGKPVGVICHGPWMLVEADVARGRTITSWPSLKTDLRNAGAKWVDQQVVTDGNLTTSRWPDDLPAFNARIIQEFAKTPMPAQAQPAEQAASAYGAD